MSKLLSPYRFECQDSANVVTGCPWCSRLILRGQFPESRTNFSTNLCIVRYVPMLRLMWSLHCRNALPVSYITRSFTTLVRIDVWEVANGITRNIISCIESGFKCHTDIVTLRRRATSNDSSVHEVVKIFLSRQFIYMIWRLIFTCRRLCHRSHECRTFYRRICYRRREFVMLCNRKVNLRVIFVKKMALFV